MATRAWLNLEHPRTNFVERLCLEGFQRVVIGRGRHCHVRMNDERYARTHAALTRDEAGWSVADQGSPGGTFINQAQMRTARRLDSGDSFSMNAEHRFRFELEPFDPRVQAHIDALLRSDDGEAAWLVFADALQELGDERGRRMLSADGLGTLGLLEPLRTDGTLEVRFRHGFVVGVTVRRPEREFHPPLQVLEAIFSQPNLCLLREAVVDVTSFEGNLSGVLDAVVRWAPPGLRQLVLLAPSTLAGVSDGATRALLFSRRPALALAWREG